MTARRHKGFRGGDLGEDLGIFLLKAVCAVAPVPRTEDVGVDAVATLLREDGDLLLAEDSFFVQLKSSRRTIRYYGHEIEWLRKLQLPFYIGYVDRKQASLTLYAAMDALSWILAGKETETTKVYFDAATKGEGYRVSLRDKRVFTWSVEEVSSDGFAERAYEVLKTDVQREQENIRNRKYGIVDHLSPGATSTGTVRTTKGGPNRIQLILEDMKEACLH